MVGAIGPVSASVQSPVVLEALYPERLSRGHLLLKSFFGWLYAGIPHFVALYVLGILSGLAVFASFFIILFTGKFPRGLFDFVTAVNRWGYRFTGYWFLITDAYPPFSLNAPENPLSLEISLPERLSRPLSVLKVFLGWLYVGIPHGIVLFFYGIAVLIAVFLAWWAILFTGKYPRGLFDFVVGYFRWQERVVAYLSLQRDEYPPFSSKP